MTKNRIGIVFAMQEEAAPLLEKFDLTDYTEPYAGARFYENDRVVIGIGDVGSLAATICTVTLIRDFGCRTIYNTGSCGSTGPKLPVGTVVSVTRVFKGDVDLTVAGYRPYELPRTPIYLELPHDPDFPAATARSTDKFIGANDKVEPNMAVEMEAFAVAYTCRRFGVDCHIYKVISDMTDKNVDSSQFDGNLADVSAALAEHVYQIIMKKEG
jgi:adenosylhomocysteine nucleosidase